MRRAIGVLIATLALVTAGFGSDAVRAADDDREPVTGKPLGAVTPEGMAEKADREACKIDICDILETREPRGPNVACDIAWTWHETEIVDALGGRIDWPWGKLVCHSKVRLDRPPLAEAMSEPRYKAVTDTQTVRCSLYHEDGKPYVVELALAPVVTFKNGKATEASVNWGELTAPKAIYPLLYAATSLDNSTNILGPEVVRQVNKFTREDCAAVKGQLPGRRVN
jgi:hypothetical protein